MWRTYPKSKKMYEAAKKVFAMGVGSQVQSFARPHPLYIAKAKGSRIYDEDGNAYIDFLLNYGPNILGHSPAKLNRAIAAQLEKGCAFGEPHRLQVELAKSLTRIVPCYEVVNFNNTGTEAVQAALRLARGFTKKTKFIKFEGHYHGWLDNVFVSFHPDANEDMGTRARPKTIRHGYTWGQPKSILEDVIALPWNDLSIVEKTLKKQHREIAAILTEPIMSNCGVIMPRPGYLEGLRKLATSYDVLLIFDEVITGQRVHLGGAQKLLGVTPDISLGSKALGGGIGILAYGARREIMNVVSERKAVHAGTFNGNAIACTAALTVLEELGRNNAAAVKRINRLGDTLKEEIGKSAKKHGITVRIQGPGAAFCVSFKSGEIWDMRDAFRQENDLYFTFRRLLLDRGIHIFPTEKGLWYTSAAHTERDIETTARKVDQVFAIMKTM
ncbi:MAG: aspartate aminotransferase family protein [Planctomycetota bacterium]